MRFNRARYIAICQQFLVTAVVIAVGLSAAGVMTLQIVAPESPGNTAGSISAARLDPAVRISEAYVDTAPITPKVREVKVRGVDTSAARETPGLVTRSATALRMAALTQPQPVHGFATVGVTWAHGVELGEHQISVQVRTQDNGIWSAWSTVQYHDDHGPDADGPEENASGEKVRPGTDALVIGDVDKVQMKAETSTGVAPAGLRLALVDPGTGTVQQQPPAIDTAKLPESDTTATTPPIEDTDPGSGPGADDLDLAAMKIAPKPTIYSRAQWGANEAMRDKSSLHYGTVKTGFIHHTVNANNYTAAQVPSLLRGIYAYHTQSRGWSDIGYNYLVDRFGRIWEGRYGGVNRAVVGAHTKGYNEVSFAMSAIGNFDIARPPQAVLDAYARLFAWKLSLYNIPADKTRIWVKNRYLQAINGHRDVGQTACPGRYLYAKLPAIRTAARKIQLGATTPPAPVVPAVDQPVIAAPADTPAPTTPPRKASKQPELDLPARISMGGSSWADIVTMNAAGDIRVMPTGGMTGFDTPVSSRGPWAAMSLIAAVGDVTGDGVGDVLAKSRGTRYARVFPGTGGGAISPHGIAGTDAFHYADTILGVGDFNRDGRNDVITRDWRDRGLYLHLGQAAKGTFAAPRLIQRNWNFVRTTAVGDYNGDGRVDLMVQGARNQLYLIAGAGGSTLGTALGPSMKLRRLTAGITAMAGWGDLDGDGNADLLVRSAGNGLVRLYTGQGNGRVRSTLGPFTNLRGLTQASLAPMMAGRAADFVGRDSSGDLVVVANNGRRNTTGPLPGNLRVRGVTQILQVGDWDLDGHADILTREVAGDRLVLRRGLGNGKFTRGRSLGNGWKQVTQLAAVGDVTGDLYPDLLGRIGGGRAILFPGNGLAAFKAPQYPATELATYNQIGQQVWRTTPTPPRVVPSADGSFVPFAGADAAAAVRTAGAAASTYDDLVGVGDVDGDGLADVLARAKSTGTLWLLPGKTSGGFAPRVWVAAGFAGYQLIG